MLFLAPIRSATAGRAPTRRPFVDRLGNRRVTDDFVSASAPRFRSRRAAAPIRFTRRAVTPWEAQEPPPIRRCRTSALPLFSLGGLPCFPVEPFPDCGSSPGISFRSRNCAREQQAHADQTGRGLAALHDVQWQELDAQVLPVQRCRGRCQGAAAAGVRGRVAAGGPGAAAAGGPGAAAVPFIQGYSITTILSRFFLAGKSVPSCLRQG